MTQTSYQIQDVRGDGSGGDKHAYRRILRSWSIMGGAAGFTYLISLARVKFTAVLLGPTGVGLLGLYSSALVLIGAVSGLGINASGVREVALASSDGDAEAVARTFRILRRVCWATGLLGWLLAVVLAYPISVYLFTSPNHVVALCILGGTLLLNAAASARQALLQGLQRIEEVAWVNVLGALLSTIVAIGLYAWLGEAGIVPVLVVTAAISFALAYGFSRKLRIASAPVSWADTLTGSGGLLRLGVAFMLIGVNTAGLDTLTRLVVTNGFGVEAAGIYQSAWALSGTFAGVVLAAMGTDFYPRLSGAIHDKAAAARLISQQTEIGILMALPGTLAALLFAPQCMRLFFTDQFLTGADLLRGMMLGVFCKVLVWPLDFVPMAKGTSRWGLGVNVVFTCVRVVTLVWLEHVHGLVGVAQAFAASLALQVLVTLQSARLLIGYAWSPEVKRLAAVSAVFILASFVIPLVTGGVAETLAGALMMAAGCLFGLRGLLVRLGAGGRAKRWMAYVPGGWLVLIGIDA